MKLLLLTNMPSYHQMDLARALASELGDDQFRLVFHHPTSDERREMGWQDQYQAPWLIRFWESAAARQETEAWIESADVVVQGRFPLEYIRDRVAKGKLTFCYQERFWKRRFSWLKVLLRLPRIYSRYWSLNRPNYHLLGAGAYVAPELQQLGVFRGRSWKYGYFIDGESTPPKRLPDGVLRLLWCARFSALKQPLRALEIVAGLHKAGHAAHLTMVGDGELRTECEQWAAERLPEGAVFFAGWQDEAQVQTAMQTADALLMTSTHREGWALVVNEAMRQGCAIIAHRAIGSAPWLVRDGETGLLYDDTELQSLIQILSGLSTQMVQEMGEAGRLLHQQQWSAQSAAKRLVCLSQLLLSGDDASELFQDGPCSAA